MTKKILLLAVAWLWLVTAAAAEPADRVAEAAALADRAEAGSADAVAALVPLIHDPDSKVRYQAEWGLARSGAAAVPLLAAELAQRSDDEERARVARLLGRVGPFAAAAIPELRAALADPDSSAAGAASYALGHVRAREAVPDLVAAYAASRKIPNQAKMAQALQRIGADQGLRTARSGLVRSVREDLDSEDTATAAAAVTYSWALYRAVVSDGADAFPAKAQLRPLVPGLIAALDAPDPKIAEQAVKALTLAGRDAADAVPRLAGLIGHPTLHHAVIKALQGLGSPEAERLVADTLLRDKLDRRIRSGFSVRDHQGRTELLPFRVAGSAEDGLQIAFRFLYPGRAPRPPTHVVVYVESTSDDERFEQVREIQWRADGVAIPMRDLDRTWSQSQRGGVIEYVSGLLTVEEFRALARAQRLGARAGGVAFTLVDEDRAALRHFAASIPSAASGETAEAASREAPPAALH